MALTSITESRYESPLGSLLIALSGNDLVALDFADYSARYERLLMKGYGQVDRLQGAVPDPIAQALDDYFAGSLDAIDRLDVNYAGTDFQNNVWRALREIPAGDSWTYGQLAQHIGSARAVRAVGRTNGLNPVAIVGPCHRVVGANGKLTGYAGGLERKRWLLAHEAKHAGTRLL